MLEMQRERRFDCAHRSRGFAHRPSGSAHQSRGVALITVLLVFALVAVIATEMLRRSQLSLRSVGNLIETRQAYYYALGGEAYARQLLAKDVIDGRDAIDTLSEPWAQTQEQQPFEIEDGNMKIEINDLQGRFNLNSVVLDALGAQPNPAGVDQFKRLLTALQLNPNYAYEWLDWIDRDQTRSANGAEDADYTGYRTAAHPEADISALHLLHSMQPQDYAKLAPHVTVLPLYGSANLINVNTADAEVLRSISTKLSEAQAAQIIAKQKTGGYINVVDAGLTDDVATVKSGFFEVVVTVNYANRWQRVRTVLQRTKNTSGQVEIIVISRLRSPLIDDMDYSTAP